MIDRIVLQLYMSSFMCFSAVLLLVVESAIWSCFLLCLMLLFLWSQYWKATNRIIYLETKMGDAVKMIDEINACETHLEETK